MTEPSPHAMVGGSRARRRYAAFGLLAAGIAAFVYAGAKRTGTAREPVAWHKEQIAGDGLSPSSPNGRDDDVASLSLWPSLAYASEDSTPGEAPYDPVPAVFRDSLALGTRVYVRSSASSYSGKLPISATEIELRSATVSSVPAWRLVTTDPLRGQSAAGDPLRIRYDSVWLRKSDLQLLQRRWRSGMALISQRRLGDSAIARTDTVKLSMVLPGKSDRVFTAIVPLTAGRLLVTDFASMSVVIRSLPLHGLWRGSIDVSGSKYGPNVPSRSLNLSVQGDSIVPTLWGYVPCWRVMLHTGKNPERWYVSKQGHEVLLVDGPDGREWPRSRLDLIGRYLK